MKYGRLLSRLYNTPLAIAQSKLDILSSEITLKLLSGGQLGSLSTEDSAIGKVDRNSKVSINSHAIVNVFDGLVSKNGGGDSGSTSYQSITNRVNSLIAEGYKTIYFYIDSPGGEVSGLFGLAAFIASLPSYGIRTIAITDGLMASAAYVIGSACQECYATSSSIVGSIGVIMTLINTVEADKQDGLTYEILRSKGEKALINSHEPLTNEARADALKVLSTLDNIMNTTVNKHRPSLSLETILKLNGNTVLGEEALALNLIDGIVESFDAVVSKEKYSKNKTSILSTTTIGKTMTLEEAMAENIRLSTELQAIKASTSLQVAKAKVEERDRVLGILEAQKTFKLPLNAAISNIKQDMSIDQTVSMFEIIKEHTQQTNHLDTSGVLDPTINPTMNTETGAGEFHSTLKAALDKVSSIKPLFEGVI